MRWFRFYDDAVNDPKVQRLAASAFKFWVNMLCLASKSGGTLPAISDIAYSLRMTEARVRSQLQDLCAAGLIDGTDGVLTPHNWSQRQYQSDTSTGRVKRFRQRFCNGAEQKQSRSEAEQSRADSPPAACENGKERKMPSKEAERIARKVAEVLEGDPESKQWHGSYVETWLVEGHSEERILSAAERVKSRGTEVKSITYLYSILKEEFPASETSTVGILPPTGMRASKSTGEYIQWGREKYGPDFNHGHLKYSKWQFVPADWHPSVTPLRKASA